MSNLINTFLGKTIGINFIRAKSRKVNRVKGKPIFVEFVGASGVGKTTLFQNTFKEIKSKWLHSSEFRKIYINHINGKTTEPIAIYQKLAQLKIQSVLTRNCSEIERMDLISYFHSVLIEDNLVYLFNKNYNVITDDGLIHNFSDCLSPLSKSHTEELANILKHRTIIYCHTSAENVAKRILERKSKTGQLLPQHRMDSFDELVHMQIKSLHFKQQVIDTLSKYDVPILTIDTSDSTTENVDRIKQFLDDFNCKR